MASGSVRGVALDIHHAESPWLADAVRVLRAGGRLVAPASAPLPAGTRELARDDREWVAVAEGTPATIIPLRRSSP
jgi:hypothetical protein